MHEPDTETAAAAEPSTAEPDTAVEHFKEYPVIHGVLIVDSNGLATTNHVSVSVNTAPLAYRHRPDLASIAITINGLGVCAFTVAQINRLLPSLAAARHDAELALAHSTDLP